MTIAFDTFETQILAWFAAVTAIPTRMRNRETKRFQSKSWAELHILSSAALGVDEVRREFNSGGSPGSDVDVQIAGQRLVTVSCRVKSRSQEPLQTARFYLERARTSLSKPAVRATHFDPFQIAVVRTQPLVDLDFDEENRVVSLANMDVVFETVVDEADAPVSHIASAVLSSDLKNVDGSSLPAVLQLDNVELP
jgi:hypothetical protein